MFDKDQLIEDNFTNLLKYFATKIHDRNSNIGGIHLNMDYRFPSKRNEELANYQKCV